MKTFVKINKLLDDLLGKNKKARINNICKLNNLLFKNYQRNRTQTQNSKSKQWIKIDTLKGRIIGSKDTPYKNVRRV